MLLIIVDLENFVVARWGASIGFQKYGAPLVPTVLGLIGKNLGFLCTGDIGYFEGKLAIKMAISGRRPAIFRKTFLATLIDTESPESE